MFHLIANNQRARVLLCHFLKYTSIFCLLDRAFDRRAHERNPELLGRPSHRWPLTTALPYRTGCEESHRQYTREGFSQKSEPLAPNLNSGVYADPGDVAARPCQAINYPKSDRVSH